MKDKKTPASTIINTSPPWILHENEVNKKAYEEKYVLPRISEKLPVLLFDSAADFETLCKTAELYYTRLDNESIQKQSISGSEEINKSETASTSKFSNCTLKCICCQTLPHNSFQVKI